MARRLVYAERRKPVGQVSTARIDNRFGNHPEVIAAGLPTWSPRPYPREDDPNYPEERGKWIEEQIALGAGEDV